jgi:hypothetical protein
VQPHWLAQPKTIRRLWVGLGLVLALTLIGEPLVETHPHFAVDSLPGFNAIYGFLTCAAMIVLAKAIGFVLKRPETYYSDRTDD